MPPPHQEPYTLDFVRSVQITRTGVVQLLNHADVQTIVPGFFVRVLLELENSTEDYRVAYVRTTENGPSYQGFTQDVNARTTLHLVLDLPGELHGINGSQFQLNSISNSNITQQELDELNRSQHRFPSTEAFAPKVGLLASIRNGTYRRLSPQPDALGATTVQSSTGAMSGAAGMQTVVVGSRQPQNGGGAAAAVGGGNALVQQGTMVADNLNATTIGGAGAPQAGAPTVHARTRREATEEENPTEEQLLRVVMEELREKNEVFPKKPENQKIASLRTTERDILEYLDQVRESIRQNRQNCIVCADRPPTVISLPCKHQVLCRLCATQVKNCPICREMFVELFEPLEE